MRYDQYYQKILKLKKKRDFIYRYRYLFISIWTAITVVSGSLFSLKGYVVNETFFSPSVIYGEVYQPNGSALFDNVVYEYAERDRDEWQTDAPILVGDYKVRGKSSNNFGEFYYGDTFYFAIIPKKLDVQFKETALTYGNTPTLDINLVYNDEVAVYDVIYDDFSTRDTWINVDLTTLKIINPEGEDVTFCYDITSEKQSLGLLPRPLTYSFAGANKIYDGNPLSNETYTLSGTLAFEDYYVLGSSQEQIAIGQSFNQRDIQIFNQDDLDITHLYDLRVNSGILAVAPRPLTITSASLTKVYDGTAFPQESFLPNYDASLLLPGHELITVFEHENTFQQTQSINSFTYYIQDENEEVVTSLYDLTITPGSFSIAPRPITLTTNSAQKVYDGSTLTEPTYQITDGSLAPTDTLASTCESTLTNAGRVANACTYELTHESGVDVKSSYTMTPIPGELLIQKRPLVITLQSLSQVYDGTLLVGDQYSYTGELAVNQRLEFKTAPTTLRTVGKVNNTVQFQVLDENDQDVSINYDLVILGAQGSLEITKRPLSVQSDSAVKDYDASNLSASGYTITDGTLANGEGFVVQSSPVQKNVGTQANIQQFIIRNTTTLTNVTANYDITYVPGQLEVRKTSRIILTSLDFQKTYDDVPYVSTTPGLVQLVKDGPFTSEQITLSAVRVTSTQLNAGTGQMVIDPNSIVLRNTGNEIVTGNYFIDIFNTGNLSITKRNLSLKMNDLNKVYDGTPLVAQNGHTFTLGSTLVTGHRLVFTNPEDVRITNVSESPRGTQTIAQIFKQNEDVTSNYNLSWEEGTLTLNKRKIQVTTSNHQKVYDGTALRYTPTATITSRLQAPFNELPLAPGHTLQATFSYFEPINVLDRGANNGFNVATVKVLDANAVDVSANYEINYVFGFVRINPRPIQVGLITTVSIYDGQEKGHQVANMAITANSSPMFIRTGTLPQGYSMQAGVDVRQTTAGLKGFELINLRFFDGQNNQINNENFAPETFGNVWVIAREITVSFYSGDKDYDGNPYVITPFIAFGQLVPGDTIEYDLPELIERGTYSVQLRVARILNASGQVVTDSYKINYPYVEVVII